MSSVYGVLPRVSPVDPGQYGLGIPDKVERSESDLVKDFKQYFTNYMMFNKGSFSDIIYNFVLIHFINYLSKKLPNLIEFLRKKFIKGPKSTLIIYETEFCKLNHYIHNNLNLKKNKENIIYIGNQMVPDNYLEIDKELVLFDGIGSDNVSGSIGSGYVIKCIQIEDSTLNNGLINNLSALYNQQIQSYNQNYGYGSGSGSGYGSGSGLNSVNTLNKKNCVVKIYSENMDIQTLRTWYDVNVVDPYYNSTTELYYYNVISKKRTVSSTIYNNSGLMQPKSIDSNNSSSREEIKEFFVTKKKLTSNKTFDNLFGNHIKLAKKYIDFFIDHKESFYERLGNPYTLGFLLHGPPGTGKTSFIKALSNYLKRDVVNVDLSIMDKITLNNLFNGDVISSTGVAVRVDISRAILVLEDIDCLNSVVLERNNGLGNVNSTGLDNMSQGLLRSEGPRDLEDLLLPAKTIDNDGLRQDSEKLDLAFLLNLIDGVIEQSGRIIIMTSNYPDRIDKALLRPGRVDHTIKFDYCDNTMVSEMYESFFGTSKTFDISGKRLTAARVNQVLCENHNDPELAYNVINEM
jgi:hypothetical protein